MSEHGSPLAQIEAWPVTTAAAAIVTADGMVDVRGPVDRRLALASVTKVLTALACWVAWEEGTLDLDEAAGPPGATVRHLLAHASGLSPDGDEVVAKPGHRRIYSNRGIELAAGRLAERAAMPFGDYLAEAVLTPLGLRATTVEGSPASGGVATVTDLARVAAELLTPTIVAPATLASATSVAFPGLDGVLPGFGRQRPNDWGVGVEVRGSKSPHWTSPANSPATFGHFGQAGGFVWVDPVLGVACVSLTDQPFGTWAVEAWPRLATAVVESLTG